MCVRVCGAAPPTQDTLPCLLRVLVLFPPFSFINMRVCVCLAREQDTYKEWTVLGQVDLDSFVDAHVTTAQEFEDNFKAVRARRREAEKLPEIIKVSKGGGVFENSFPTTMYVFRELSQEGGMHRASAGRIFVLSRSALRCCSAVDKIGCVSRSAFTISSVSLSLSLFSQGHHGLIQGLHDQHNQPHLSLSLSRFSFRF